MTRTLVRIALLVAVAPCLGGCTTVHVDRPVGNTPVTLDPVEWNGTWCDPRVLVPGAAGVAEDVDEACVSVTVVDAEGGVLDVASTSEPGESSRAHLRQAGSEDDAILVSVEDEAAFAFEVRAGRDGDLLFAWSVSGSAVAREIEAGRLAGRVENGSVWLDPTTPAVLARLVAPGGELYDWTHPVVLVRVRQ